MMDHRIWISIDSMPFDDEEQWLPLIEHLDRRHPELGAIASWDEESTMVIVMAADEPDRAAAAERAVEVVAEALHANALADRFPSVFQVEPLDEEIAA